MSPPRPRAPGASAPRSSRSSRSSSSNLIRRRRASKAQPQPQPQPQSQPQPEPQLQSVPTKVPPSPMERWIIQLHDPWSRLTLSSFYQDLEENALSPTQFACFLLDRSAISMAVLRAATRVNETLKNAGRGGLPLIQNAKEDAHFLYEFALKQGFDMTAPIQISHAAKRLIEILNVSTAPDTPFEVAITAVWAYMMSSWSGWALYKERARNVPQHFEPIANLLSRKEAVIGLMGTQIMLNTILDNESKPVDLEKGCKTFEEVIRRSCAVLDNTLYLADASRVPLCVCGRKGHVRSQCTFKSHI